MVCGHLALDELQARDLSLGLPIRPRRDDSVPDGVDILFNPLAKDPTKLFFAFSSQSSSLCAVFERIMDWKSSMVSRAAVINRAIPLADGVRASPLWLAFAARCRRCAHCETTPLCPAKPFSRISRQRAKAFRVPSSLRLLSHGSQLSSELGRVRKTSRR